MAELKESIESSPDGASVLDEKKIKKIIESLIFASEEPLTEADIFKVLKKDFVLTKKQIKNFLDELANEYDTEERGFILECKSLGYQLKSRPDYYTWVQALFTEKRYERLSKPALETLAIIAYKQPISRGEIEQIRGVNADGVMRILIEKELIIPSGRKEIPGKPWLYSTSKKFLVNFGLNHIKELPPLGELNLN